MKELKQIFNKKIVVLIITYFTILMGIRLFQDYSIRNLVEFSISFVSIFIVLILGLKALGWCIIVFITVLMHLDHNMMYLALCFYTILAFFQRKYLIPLTISYHLNVLIAVAFDQNQLNVNVIIYISLCIIIFCLIYFYPKYKKIELKLTDDEKYILDELLQGKQLKEIDKFSKNTITIKLKNAYTRNNLMNKEELLFLYKYNCD